MCGKEVLYLLLGISVIKDTFSKIGEGVCRWRDLGVGSEQVEGGLTARPRGTMIELREQPWVRAASERQSSEKKA